jgi:hypothetical protein
MLAALLLGLTGSITHCVGMCSGVAIMLGRSVSGWRLLALHLGRICTYAILGGAAGGVGYALGAGGHTGHGGAEQSPPFPALTPWQGGLAILAAIAAIYMALALIGRAPSPELLLGRMSRWWGRTMQRRRQAEALAQGRNAAPGVFSLFVFGLLWGLLPCGLVLAALLLAATSGSPWRGSAAMLLFGLGTWPVGFGLGAAARAPALQLRWRAWLRPLTAAIVLIFGLQMALRGLAAWGWAPHVHWGGLMLW